MKRNTMAGILTALAMTLAALLVGCELGGAETPPSNLVRPYISEQPESRSFYTDNYVPYALTVEVWDWNSKDGDIACQWYSFEDIDVYCANGGTAINGATGFSYTPTVSPVAGKLYYFYAVVSNSKSDALDVTSASLQSEIATIAFSARNSPLFPIISRNPANASYRWGRPLNALKVEARLPKVINASGEEVTASGTMTYQWFSNTGRKIAGGSPIINNADTASFIPDYDILKMDENFFYVKVTNTLSGNEAVAIGIPALINMELGLKAGAPRITKQPSDRLFFTTDTITPLKVQGESPDLGAISYQWYSNTSALNSGGTPIDGQTNESFTPPNTPNAFYYALVTNTNEKVTGEQDAALASKAVQVRIVAPGNIPPENAVVTIPDPKNIDNQAQYVRGYGGMHVAWDNFPRLDKEDVELMYNPDKMGYNILRIMIRPDNIDIRTTMDEMVYGKLSQFYADFYENCKIVNKYGGYVAASPWTPPKEWKSNNSINGGGNLIPAYYRLFANYLRTFAQLMYDKGAPIYCISISNEPNYVAGYDGCEWSPDEMMNFWKEVGRFTNGIRGYGGGKELPYVLTMNGESANTPVINRAVLRNPQAKAVVDLLARHIYGERTVSLWNHPEYRLELQKGAPTDLNKGRLEVWMTEHNINSANATGYYNDSSWDYVWRFLNDIDLVMRINNENAFVWWASKRFYSMVGDGQFGAKEHEPLPRGWALTHYARYTIDTTRILLPNGSITGTFAGGDTIGNTDDKTAKVNNTDDNLDNVSARITAYVSQDGNEISMVMWTPTKYDGTNGYDLGNVRINLPQGFKVNGVKAHRSWAENKNDKEHLFLPDDTVTVSADRSSAYVNLPRGQILSVKFTQ